MTGAGERSIAAVLGSIAGNIQDLVRSEIRLAKLEVKTEISTAARGTIFLAAGGGVAFVALTFLALAGVYALATVVALWIAALIVAGATALVGGLLVAAGLNQFKKVSFAIPRTVANIRESVEWAKPSAR